MARFKLVDGIFVPADSHTSGTPESKMEYGVYGQGPATHVKSSPSIADKFRKFDRPSESEIKSAILEDEQITKNQIGFMDAFTSAKKDLESGKLRIANDVINSYNKSIKPFSSIVDSSGVTHIVTTEVANRYQPAPRATDPEQYAREERIRFLQSKSEDVAVKIESPTEGSIPSNVTFKEVEQKALDATKNRTNKGRTFG